MKDYVKRMCNESTEIDQIATILNNRIDGLHNFIGSEDGVFNTLSKKEQKLMTKQLDKMQKISALLTDYRDIVDQRIGINIVK